MAKKTNNRRQNQNTHHSDHSNAEIIFAHNLFSASQYINCLQNPRNNMDFKSKKNSPMKNLWSLNSF